MTHRFAKDQAEVLLQKFRDGHVDRRGFLAALAALGLGVALRPGTAQAAEGEIVLCNWGGIAVDAFQEAFGGPFTAQTGMKLVIDGAGPALGSVRTMVDNGNVIWDVMDNGLIDAQVLATGNYVEPIDYSIVDKNKVPDFSQEFGVGNYAFANVLFHNKKTTGAETLTDWRDFFDFEKFPGKRTMCKWIQGQLEFVLLADGVAPADLYPLDVDRAFAKLDAIRPHVTAWWSSGAQHVQMLVDREVVLSSAWNGRIFNAVGKGSPLGIAWEGSAIHGAYFGIPKGAANAYWSQRFLAAATDPQAQASFANRFVSPGLNPLSTQYADPAVIDFLPTKPENLAVSFWQDDLWWADNLATVKERWQRWMLG